MNRLLAREVYTGPGTDLDGPPPTLKNDLSSAPNIFIRLLFIIFFIFDLPAFTVQLAIDRASGQWTGSPVISAMTLLGEVFAALVILTSRDARALAKRCWPVLGLIGLGLASALWSTSPTVTIGVTFRVAGNFLLGLAIVGRMPHFQGVRFVIRAMTLGCVLSIAWVFMFPDVAVQQADDAYQTVHAGLWRGIFSHKQGLGLFAGLTTGLLLFYRTLIFPAVLWVGALGCSIGCLVGTTSATGFITAVITPVFFYAGRLVVMAPEASKRSKLTTLVVAFLLVGAAFKTGLLDFVIVNVIGKSSDMTGRADQWPIALANFNASGRSLLGGGLQSGFAADLSEWSIDNGYIDMLIDFGYLLVPVVFWMYGAMMWKGAKLLLTSSRQIAATNVFPFGFLMVILIANITESNFMAKTYGTVLTAMAAALLFEERNLQAKKPVGQIGT